jgi:phosphoesterase RecJ-like protein
VSIDHHYDNPGYATVNILQPEASSTAEILYFLFKDWGVEADKQVAEYLLIGIIGDSGAFRYPTTSVNTLKASIDLIEKGADKNQIIRDIYSNEEIDNIIMWGEILSKMQFDKENGFVWSAIPYETYKKLGEPGAAKETAASNFAAIVKGAEFGIIMVETEKGELSLSLRSKTGFDTSKIASDLGGGGHPFSSGARIINMDFDEAVKKVLEVARKHARENK